MRPEALLPWLYYMQRMGWGAKTAITPAFLSAEVMSTVQRGVLHLGRDTMSIDLTDEPITAAAILRWATGAGSLEMVAPAKGSACGLAIGEVSRAQSVWHGSWCSAHASHLDERSAACLPPSSGRLTTYSRHRCRITPFM